MLENKFKDKIVWITGANKGIGKGIANELITKYPDTKFILSSSSQDTIKTLVTEFMDFENVYYFPFDLSDRNAINKTHKKIENSLGGVDVLINNAGVGKFGITKDLTLDDLDLTLDINVKAPFSLMKKVLPGMIENKFGAIINILSVVVTKTYPYSALYTASKAALLSIDRTLREEVRSSGIKIIDIMPGATETEIWEEHQREKFADRMMQPDDVGKAVANIFDLISIDRLMVEEIVLRPQLGDL